MYRLRLNENPDLEVEVEHAEKVGTTEVELRDVAVFPPSMFKEPARIWKAELFDDQGELWAMRRIPEHFAPLASPCIQFTFNWTLRIYQEV